MTPTPPPVIKNGSHQTQPIVVKIPKPAEQKIADYTAKQFAALFEKSDRLEMALGSAIRIQGVNPVFAHEMRCCKNIDYCSCFVEMIQDLLLPQGRQVKELPKVIATVEGAPNNPSITLTAKETSAFVLWPQKGIMKTTVAGLYRRMIENQELQFTVRAGSKLALKGLSIGMMGRILEPHETSLTDRITELLQVSLPISYKHVVLTASKDLKAMQTFRIPNAVVLSDSVDFTITLVAPAAPLDVLLDLELFDNPFI